MNWIKRLKKRLDKAADAIGSVIVDIVSPMTKCPFCGGKLRTIKGDDGGDVVTCDTPGCVNFRDGSGNTIR